jgi:hypothetical protein
MARYAAEATCTASAMPSRSIGSGLPRLRAACLLNNELQDARWFEAITLLASLKMVTAVLQYVLISRSKCGRRLLNRDVIQHLLPFQFVRSMVSFLYY